MYECLAGRLPTIDDSEGLPVMDVCRASDELKVLSDAGC